MSTDFNYNNTLINATGPLKQNEKDVPNDTRIRVETYADIKKIPNPYNGMTITVISDETNDGKMTDYKVKSLVANIFGMPNAVVGEVVKYSEYLGINSSSGSIDEETKTLLLNMQKTIDLLNTRVAELENKVDVTGISLNTNKLECYLGDTVQLTSIVLPYDATNKNIVWSSSNESIATVNNGLVTIVEEGYISNTNITITATTEDHGYIANCDILVKSKSSIVNVTGITLNQTNINATELNKTYTLIATITPSNATNQNITWTSLNDSIATVNNGIVTIVGKGSTTITVTTQDGNYSATCSISVTIQETTKGYLTDENSNRLMAENGSYLLID